MELHTVADAQARHVLRDRGRAQEYPARLREDFEADMITALKQSFDMCDAVFAGNDGCECGRSGENFGGQVPRVSVLYGVLIHSNECYGNMAVYMRLKGLVPPSTEGDGRWPGTRQGRIEGSL